MLSVTTATPEQIKKILEKHLNKVYNMKYSCDGDDEISFIWCSSSRFMSSHYQASIMGAGIMQWQVRGNSPCFFSFQKGGKRYDVNYPSDELLKRLIELSNVAKTDFENGSEI